MSGKRFMPTSYGMLHAIGMLIHQVLVDGMIERCNGY